jgi:hypothetical protein
MRRAADQLKAQNAKLQRIRENNRAEENMMWGGLAAAIGVLGAAAVDKKFGEGGAQAEYFDVVPANLANGGVLVATALGVKSLGKARIPLGMLGLGSALGSLYRFGFDNFDFSESA